MVDFVLFVMAAVGLSHILVDGSIMQPVKNKLKNFGCDIMLEIMSCYQCSGWWSGLFMGSLYVISWSYPWVKLVMLPFAASLASVLMAVVIMRLNANNG